MTGKCGASVAGGGLRVALLHDYREDLQPSMRLYADRLGSALVRRDVHVIRVKPPAVVPRAWRTRASSWNNLDLYIGRFAVYPRLVSNLRADVVHIIDHGQGYLVGSLDSRRTVVTCHDLILLAVAIGRIGSTPVPPLALQLLRVSVELMKLAAVVIADSTQTKRDLVDFVGMDPDRIQVIHPGINYPFRPDAARGREARARFNLGEGPIVLQIGGEFCRNLPAVLRVLKKLRAGGVDVRVVRVGPPMTAADGRLAEQLGVGSSVIDLGEVSDEDLASLYNAVDVLLFPSVYEGFGWPPVEAMASALPVVSSRSGSLDEVVGDAALTADPDDIEALAWHVGTVLTDSTARERLVARGLARAAQFSWDRTATQVIQVYRDVMERAA